jgi:hypothetical protein
VIEPSAEKPRSIIDVDRLPSQFPTHRHSGAFWEQLGRTVATFGFLEDVLGRAIFAFTGTVRYEENEIDEAALAKWLSTLERALADPLGGLIDAYGKAVRSHPEAIYENIDELLSSLRDAAQLRNVLCHGSWGSPDAEGKSIPRYVSNKMLVFDAPVDIAYLKQTQRAVAELACHVIDSVTSMGYQFPGSKGPGTVVY